MTTTSLLRAHPALRRLPQWLGVTLAVAGTALGLILWYASSKGRLPWRLPIALGWFVLSVLFLTLRRTPRGRPFALSLPLSASRLWGVHLLALLLSGLATLGVALGLSGLALWFLQRSSPGGVVIDALPPLLLLQLPAVLLLLIGWREFDAGETLRPPVGRAGLASNLAVAGLSLGLLMVSPLPAALTLLLILGLATLLLGSAARRLPASLQLAGSELVAPASAAATGELPRTESGGGHAWLLWKTVLRQTAKNRFAFGFGLAFFVVFGALLSGGLSALDTLRVTMGPITVYLFLALVGGPLLKVAALDALPIARWQLLAMLALPALLAAMLGYGLGSALGSTLAPTPALPRIIECRSGYCLELPAGMARVAWDGELPVPVGGVPISSAPLLRGLRPRMIWPYDLPSGASRDQAERQLMRARAALPAPSPPSAAVLLLLPFAWSLALVAVFLRSFRAAISERRRKLTFFALLAVLMLLHLLAMTALLGGARERIWRDGVPLLLAPLPGGAVGQWLLTSLLVLGAFALAARALARAEFVPGGASCGEDNP